MAGNRVINDMARNFIVFIICIAFSVAEIDAQFYFDGNLRPPVEVVPPASTGLKCIYVLPRTEGVVMSYKSDSGQKSVWQTYGNLGGGFAEGVEDVTYDTQGMSTVTLKSGDKGYIITEGSRQTCVWVVDYSCHELILDGLSLMPESDCATASLQLEGDASPIYYWSINGRRHELSRDMSLDYMSMVYDPDRHIFVDSDISLSVASVETSLHVDAPLCPTAFRLVGDRFTSAWGRPLEVESGYYESPAVEAHIRADQISRRPGNMIVGDGNSALLGGSAPCEITFDAAVSIAAVFHEWQLSRDAHFDVIDDRSSELEFTVNIREQGTTYVRFVADNADGTCEFVSEVLGVEIGESELRCPNAFSPGGSEGVNDEWRVSYKSIIDFDCHIFNRWGVEVAHLNLPDQGWNGYYHGKLVPSGVYFYVIKATGADGRRYNLKGDINVIRYNDRN